MNINKQCLKSAWILICFIFYFNINIQAQERNTPSSVEGESIKIKQDVTEDILLFEKEVNLITEAIGKGLYSRSIFLIDDLKYKILDIQKQTLNSFFPESFNSFSIHESDIESDSFFGEQEYGVLLNKSYMNSKNEKIDINIVHSDPSIQEYVGIVNNPRLVDGILDTTLVKVQNYDSLYSISGDDESSTIYEQNIILNEDLMITIIYVGAANDQLLLDFLELVSLKQIENYLKN